MKHLFFLLALSSSLLFVNCESTTSKNNMEKMSAEWEQEKAEISAELAEIRDDLSAKIEKLEIQLEEAGEEASDELKQQKSALNDKMVELRIKMNELENTLANNWDEFKKDVETWRMKNFDS